MDERQTPLALAPRRAVCAAGEFSRASRWCAVSANGFAVQIKSTSAVAYEDAAGGVLLDAEGRVFLEAECLTEGVRVRLDSPRTCGVAGLARDRRDEVLQRVARALRYLGYRLEIVGAFTGGER